MSSDGVGRRREGPLLRTVRKLNDRTHPVVTAVLVLFLAIPAAILPIIYLGPIKAPLAITGAVVLAVVALEAYEAVVRRGWFGLGED